jgi:tripartite-type tricarboxylate transporter receptor subunit TctC
MTTCCTRRLVAAALLALAGAATAQSPTTMVVPYPAGGPSDFTARTVLPDLQRLLGTTIVVDNVGGVSGALGIQKALAAPADGNTMVLASPMELVLAPLAMQAVRHKPDDLRPAAVLVGAMLVLATRKDLPPTSVDELIAQQRKPGAKPLSYGSVGLGSLYHLVGEVFGQQTGMPMTHVPYKGTAPMVTDLMGGQIDIAFLPLAGSVPQMIKDGKIKALGVKARQPHPLLPQVPALGTHKALDRFEFDLWAGIFVTRRVPDAAVERLNAALQQAMTNPETRKAFESTGNVLPQPMSVAQLNAFYTAETSRYQAIARAANVQPQ